METVPTDSILAIANERSPEAARRFIISQSGSDDFTAVDSISDLSPPVQAMVTVYHQIHHKDEDELVSLGEFAADTAVEHYDTPFDPELD